MTRHATRILMIPLAFAIVACSKDNSTGPSAQTFVATMNSANEPSLKSPSQATGTATFSVNGSQITLVSLVVQNMDSVTASHIHLGPAGVSGGIAVPLLALNPPTGKITASQTLASNLPITASTIVGISGAAPISIDSLLVLFNNGGAYVNVHTRANPAGEIRGQIVRQ